MPGQAGELVKTDLLDSVAIEALFRHSPLGLAVLDADKRYVRINELIADVNGVPVADHIGKRPSEVIPNMAAVIEQLLDHVFSTRMPMQDLEIETPTPTSEFGRRFRLSLYPLTSGDDVVGALGIVEQID
jgi:PAS domain-containing protein